MVCFESNVVQENVKNVRYTLYSMVCGYIWTDFRNIISTIRYSLLSISGNHQTCDVTSNVKRSNEKHGGYLLINFLATVGFNIAMDYIELKPVLILTK